MKPRQRPPASMRNDGRVLRWHTSSRSLCRIQAVVNATLERCEQVERGLVEKWQQLHQTDAADLSRCMDPEISVGEAGPSEAAGAAALSGALGID